MKVRSLIRLQQTKVTPSASVARVWQLLAQRNITLLSVVDETDKLVGVIGEDDLLYRLVPDYRDHFSEFYHSAPNIKDVEINLEKEIRLTAQDVMNKKVITIGPDQEIFKALAKMMAYNIRVLPVVDEEQKFYGMIFEDDIMQYLFKKHKHVIKKGK